MNWSAWRNKLPIFWWLQIFGWGLFGLFALFPQVLMRFSSQSAIFSVLFLMPAFMNTLLLRRLYKNYRTQGTSPKSLLRLVIKALGVSLGFGCLWPVFLYFFSDQNQAQGIQEEVARLTQHFSMHIFMLVSWSGLYFGVKHWQDLQAQKESILTAHALAQQSQLQLLRYQLNPHFFFNALNSIRVLVVENPARATGMITQLSDFLRYSLTTTEISKTPLKHEIEAIENYLAIERIRFEDRLQVKYDIDPRVEERMIPSFLIHPLVENAIKYGMATSDMPLEIIIRISAQEDNLIIEVTNTGHWVAPGATIDDATDGTGIGLQNLRQRLHHLYTDRYEFNVTEEEGRVVAHINIHD